MNIARDRPSPIEADKNRDRSSPRSGAGACRPPAVGQLGNEPNLAGTGPFRTRLTLTECMNIEPLICPRSEHRDAGWNSTHALGDNPEARFLQTPGRALYQNRDRLHPTATYRARTGGEGKRRVQLDEHRLSL